MNTLSDTARLGVDLGGTKTEAAIIDAEGACIVRHRIATPHSYDATLNAISELCDQVEADCGIPKRSLAVGIGTPGSPSPRTARMRNCNSTHLNGQRLKEDLAKATERAVRIANDADCFVLSETRDGAAAGAASAFGVILGTGVGGGITVNGQLLTGPNAIAGEWGHNRLPLERVTTLPRALLDATRPCYCGKTNCIETWLSGPGLALTHEVLHREAIDAAALHRADLSPRMEATLDVYCALAGAALAQVINILDPAIIVLGGGLSQLKILYAALPHSLQQQVFSDGCTTPIVQALHGDSSGVRGAAWLW